MQFFYQTTACQSVTYLQNPRYFALLSTIMSCVLNLLIYVTRIYHTCFYCMCLLQCIVQSQSSLIAPFCFSKLGMCCKSSTVANRLPIPKYCLYLLIQNTKIILCLVFYGVTILFQLEYMSAASIRTSSQASWVTQYY